MGLSVVQMGYEDEGLILSDWVHLQTNPMSVVFLFSIDVIASLFCEDKNEILHDFSSGWKRIKCPKMSSAPIMGKASQIEI